MQDAIPDAMLNSHVWRELLPLAAQSGRDHESARMDMLASWVWGTVLPSLIPFVDALGYGDDWRAMCRSGSPAMAELVSDTLRATERLPIVAWGLEEVAESAAIVRSTGLADIHASAVAAAWAAIVAVLCYDARESTREWAQKTADYAFARVARGDTAFYPGNCPTCSARGAEYQRLEAKAVNEALIAANTPEGQARQRAEHARINAENSRWDAHDDF